ncbi:MAG: pyridoxal-phosphate dependent enzyme [Burkholderiales bacterium]|nr:pyridoxal-phosphate dependent enzyme [Burkholderiales bacterium]
MAKYFLKCADCDHREPETEYRIVCPKCKGFLEVAFESVPAEPLDRSQPSIFKFHRVMPYEATPDVLDYEHFEPTPIVPAGPLSERLGIDLYFKDETLMPSGTWKDREGYVSAHRLLINHVKDLVIFSSGNTATSLARSISIIRGPRLHIVLPEASRDRIQTYAQFFDPEFVKVHYFAGSNDECIVAARKLAQEQGYTIEGGFSNYARREGLKLLGLEVATLWDRRPDWYVQPVAGGIGVYSFYKAYADLGRAAECPRILGVQAEICPPMVNAWRDNSSKLEQRHVPQTVIPSDFVRVLRTREPADSYPVVKKVTDKVNGAFEAVNDQEIYEALRAFYREPYYLDHYQRTGMLIGLEPATALAGVIKSVKVGTIEKGSSVLLNVSGAAKRGDIRAEWLADLLPLRH